MDKAGILCSQDKKILQEFSRRCINRLNEHFMFKLFLSLFRSFMDDNVRKEIEKDRLIIEHAAVSFKAGNERENVDLEEIFEKTKDVDRRFLKKISLLPLSLEVRYDDIKDIRKERIALIVQRVFDILSNWYEPIPLITVIRKTFTEKNFQDTVCRILHLYNLETKALSNSLKLLHPVTLAKDVFSGALFSVMEETAQDITSEYTKNIFGGTEFPCHDRI